MQHDYTRKQGLVWQQIFLPEYAPPEWVGRGTLWNAVEENGKTKDSRLAQEFVVALSVKLGFGEWRALQTEFAEDHSAQDRGADLKKRLEKSIAGGYFLLCFLMENVGFEKTSKTK